MTTENALAGGDAASAQVDESVTSAPATDAAQQSEPNTQAQEGAEADAQGKGKSAADDNSGKSDAAKNTDKGQQEPKRNRVQARISELTRAKHDAERRAAAAVAEVARLRKPVPIREDMTDDERARAQSRQSYREEMREHAEENVKAAAAQAAETRRQIFEEKVAAVADKHPDALAKFYAVPCSPTMADYLAESDKAGEIASFLGGNPHEAWRIASLPSVAQQAIELAKLEGRLSTAQEVRRVSQAPAPAENRLKGGAAPAGFQAEKASVADFQAMLKKSGVLQ